MSTTTMNPIDRLRELGGELFLSGDKIRFHVPADSPEAREVLAQIRKNRDEVIRILRGRQARSEPAETALSARFNTDQCCACKSRLFWRSIHGPIACFRCHPPANERIVASLLYDGQVKWTM